MKQFWDLLGYKRDPLFCSPLGVDANSQSLFVGRDDEIRRLLVAFMRRNNGLIPIGGMPGSGKTTFVNHVQFLLSSGQIGQHVEGVQTANFVPCASPVEINPKHSKSDILKMCLASITSSIVSYYAYLGKKPPKQTNQVFESMSAVASDSLTFGGGVTVFGTGGNLKYGRGKQGKNDFLLNDVSIESKIAEVVAEVRSDISSPGTAIILDNTELLDDGFICDAANMLRDSILNIEGLWCILIGRDGVGGMLSARAPRLRGYQLTSALDVPSLSFDSFSSLVAKRHKTYRTTEDVEFPVPEEVLEFVFRASQGDLRFTLDFLNAALAEYIALFGPAKSFQLEDWIGIAQAKTSQYFEGLATDSPDLAQLVESVLQSERQQLTVSDWKRFESPDIESFDSDLESLVARELLWRRKGAKNQWSYLTKGYFEMERFLRSAGTRGV